MSNTYKAFGVTYKKPTVGLLNTPNLAVAEVASRTAYESLQHSEHEHIRCWDGSTEVDDVEDSKLVTQLIHAYHHESIAEHMSFTFHIDNLSRGALQEVARHRVSSPTVKSTRYTMSSVLYAYIASVVVGTGFTTFKYWVELNNILVVTTSVIRDATISGMWSNLTAYHNLVGTAEFFSEVLAKDNLEYIRHVGSEPTFAEVLHVLSGGKTKKNAGDGVKGFLVTDAWATSMVWTINLRSLKNFMTLRDSGAAYHGIRELARAIKEVLPDKYMKLIDKNHGSK